MRSVGVYTRCGMLCPPNDASVNALSRTGTKKSTAGGGPTPSLHLGVFGIPEERLAEIGRETERTLGRDRQRRLQCRWAVVAVREEWRVVN